MKNYDIISFRPVMFVFFASFGVNYILARWTLSPFADEGFASFSLFSSRLSVLAILFLCLFGFFYGIFQIMCHQMNKTWAFLLSRPESPKMIYVRIMIHAFLGVFSVASFPWLIQMVTHDLISSVVIPFSDYLEVLYLTPIVFLCVLIGNLSATHPAKFTMLVMMVLLPFVWFNHFHVFFEAKKYWWVVLVSIIWIGALGSFSFQPDLNKSIKAWFPSLLLALPVMVTVLAALDFIPEPSPRSYSLAHAQRGKPNPSAEELRDSLLERSDKSEVLEEYLQKLFPTSTRHRFSVGNFKKKEFGKNQDLVFKGTMMQRSSVAIWTFRNEDMLFQGVDEGNGQLIGWLGPDGFSDTLEMEDRRFTNIPAIDKSGRILSTQDGVWRVESEMPFLESLWKAAENEWLYSLLHTRDDLFFVTNTDIYFGASEYLSDGSFQRKPIIRIPHHWDPERIKHIELLYSGDHFLIYYRDTLEEDDPSMNFVVQEREADGTIDIIVYKKIDPDSIPGSVHFEGLFISPLLYIAFHDLFLGLLRVNETPFYGLAGKIKEIPGWWWVVLCLIHGLGAWFVVRSIKRQRPVAQSSLLWTVLCLLFGIPALITYATIWITNAVPSSIWYRIYYLKPLTNDPV